MACDIQNQIKVYSMLSQGKISSEQDILNIITTVLPKYTIEQALEDFESKAKSKLIEALKSVGYNFAGIPSIKTDSEERPVNNINSIREIFICYIKFIIIFHYTNYITRFINNIIFNKDCIN